MSNQEKIEMLEQDIYLVCDAQNLVDEVMDADSHYESYGKYVFLQSLGNGNEYDTSLFDVVDFLAEED